MLTSSLMTCVGQLLWKLSADGSLPLLFGGFALYGAGADRHDLRPALQRASRAPPDASARAMCSRCCSRSVLLNEPLSSTKLIGVAVIVAGLVLLARSGEGGR